jgi:hypothetical protein
MGVPKAGRFRSQTENHDLKRLLKRFDFLFLLLLGTSTEGLTQSLYIGLSTLSIFVISGL